MKFTGSFIIIALSILISCTASPRESAETSPSHQIWNDLLQLHVSEAGWVDYKGFIKDKKQLEKYLDLLSNTGPDEKSWSREEKLAYWINAYNAFTIKLIVDNYPMESILDLKPTLNIPMVNTVWHRKFFKIGGKEMSLDEIEHDILRKQFNEPRVHFAINCASYSCPPLRAQAFFADQLDQQLDEQARLFINDPLRNIISKDHIKVSKIFKWFVKDFVENRTIIDFFNQYAEIKIDANAEVNYMDYDWSLNDVRN